LQDLASFPTTPTRPPRRSSLFPLNRPPRTQTLVFFLSPTTTMISPDVQSSSSLPQSSFAKSSTVVRVISGSESIETNARLSRQGLESLGRCRPKLSIQIIRFSFGAGIRGRGELAMTRKRFSKCWSWRMRIDGGEMDEGGIRSCV